MKRLGTPLAVIACAAACLLLLCGPAQAQALVGTAFFVTPDGVAVTNYRVIEGASAVTVMDSSGRRINATVRRVDKANDLALLQVAIDKTPYLALAPSSAVRRGEHVYALSFALNGQASEPRLADGIVNATSGPQDEPNAFQISNAVPPGNAGTPLILEDGRVVGVVEVASSGVTAVKSNYLLELLGNENGTRGDGARSRKSLADAAADTEKALVRIVALNRGREPSAPTTPAVQAVAGSATSTQAATGGSNMGVVITWRDADPFSRAQLGDTRVSLTRRTPSGAVELNGGLVVIERSGKVSAGSVPGPLMYGVDFPRLLQSGKSTAKFAPTGVDPASVNLSLVRDEQLQMNGTTLHALRVQVRGYTPKQSGTSLFIASLIDGELLLEPETGLIVAGRLKSNHPNFALKRELVQLATQ